MELVLKYVPPGADAPPMELRLTLPERRLTLPVRSLAAVVEKTYKKRHGAALGADVHVYRRGARVDGAALIVDALETGDALVLRAPKAKEARAVVVAGKENASPPPAKRRRLVRIMVIADPN